MTEPVPANEQVSEQDVANFSWWLCMLPFLAVIGFFVYRYLHGHENHWLMYAIGSFVIGLLFTALVAGGAANAASSTTGGAGETKE